MANAQNNFSSESARRRTPAVSRVLPDGTLVELVYDGDARRTAFAVWKDGDLEIQQEVALFQNMRLVPFSPENNLIRSDVVLLPKEPTAHETEAALFEDIRTYLHRYVDLSPGFENVASAYVLLTWLYDAFNEVPYLRLQGDYGTGKTRALLVLGSICYKPFFASGASTVSPIFHILDAFRGTLVIDEADFRFSDEKSEIVKILNNGTVDGLPVLRTIQDRQKELNPRAFRVFGPKIVAMRGSYEDKALESRFLSEAMGTTRLRLDIPINLPDCQKKEALELRNKLLRFRFENRATAALDASLINPSLEPRLNQILVPLLSVIKDESLRREIASFATGTQERLVAERGLSVEAQVLEALAELMDRSPQAAIPLRDVTTKFTERCGAELDHPATSRWIGTVIRKRLNVMTYKTNGVFAVPVTERAKILYLCERYGVHTDIHSPKLSTEAYARDLGISGTN